MSIYSDINQVTFSGRLTAEPEFHDQNEKHSAFTKVSLASNKRWKKDNAWNTSVTYLTVYFNNGLAKYSSSLQKGDLILVCGELKHRQWTDKNGQNRTMIELMANDLRVFSKKSSSDESEPSEAAETAGALDQ